MSTTETITKEKEKIDLSKPVVLDPNFNVLSVTLQPTGVYDEIEIEDMTYDSEKQTFYYPCPWYIFDLLTLLQWRSILHNCCNQKNN